MPRVLINCVDGELLHADVPELTFDHAVLELEFRSVDPNADRALLSTAAIRQVLVGDPEPAPPATELDTWDRAAFHFNDGEVLRASIAPEATLGRFGGVWRLVVAETDEVITVGIPYTSLKGVFRIRQWDGRSPVERDEAVRADQLARILTERDGEAGAGRDARRRALLERMRSGGSGPGGVHGPSHR